MYTVSVYSFILFFKCFVFFFFGYQEDDMVKVSDRVKECSTPKILATGSLDKLNSLALVGEGMAVTKFKVTNIIDAVICLLAGYYAFNAEYPKCATGDSKNVFIFLEHLLISEVCITLPIGVDNILSSLV